MIKKKIEDIRNVRKNVRNLRAEFKKQENNFCCYDTRNMVCADDPCHAGPDLEPCSKYDINTCCVNKGCSHYGWNTQHYDTYIKLCGAKWELLMACLNFFKHTK